MFSQCFVKTAASPLATLLRLIYTQLCIFKLFPFYSPIKYPLPLYPTSLIHNAIHVKSNLLRTSQGDSINVNMRQVIFILLREEAIPFTGCIYQAKWLYLCFWHLLWSYCAHVLVCNSKHCVVIKLSHAF